MAGVHQQQHLTPLNSSVASWWHPHIGPVTPDHQAKVQSPNKPPPEQMNEQQAAHQTKVWLEDGAEAPEGSGASAALATSTSAHTTSNPRHSHLCSLGLSLQGMEVGPTT